MPYLPGMDLLKVLRRNATDPLPRQLERILRVGLRMGFHGELGLKEVPSVAYTSVMRGMKSRSIHAIHARMHPERLALVDDRRSVTYAQADDEMNRMAHALQNQFGVRAGDPVI